ARPSRAPAGGSGAAPPLALPGTVTIDEGVLVYASAGKDADRYRLEGLDLRIDATGPQLGFSGKAKLAPGDVALKISDGVVSVSPGHTLADAPLRATVAVETGDVAPLVATVVGPATSLGGGLKGTLAAAGTVGAPTASGEVKLTKMVVGRTSPQCPEPKRRTLAIPSVSLAAGWRDGRLTGQPVQADVSKGTVTARLTADVARGMRVQLDDLAVKGIALEPVLVDFLCQGYAIAGPLDLTGALAFTAARPLETLSGPGSLKVGAGKIVGKQALALIGNVVRVGGTVSSLLSADLPPSTFVSPVEFDSITGTYTLTDGVFSTRDLVYASRTMKVAMAGDYVLASGAMNLDMVVSHGRGDVRAKVTGTAAAPSIRIVPASVLQNLDREKVEGGLRDLLKRFR
ncbi:MAG TPA: AsmA-like C-terminal region-containing protein, partial [Terriglobales bacterium]|nr:AsmA-like C-terminal region-containing protein [Terriglobales bacterium]